MLTPLHLLDRFRRLSRYADALQKTLTAAYEPDITFFSMLEAERKAIEILAADAERELEKRRIKFR